MSAPITPVESLQGRFRIASTDHRRRSPFNARLLAAIADRPDVASILQAAPPEQQLPVLLLAAVHSLVLADASIELADWYPTTRSEPRTDDPFPAFVRVCQARNDELRAIVATRSTQTNEVGRCALFLPVLAELARERGPLALIDIGTSAGLNLRLDRYAYDYTGDGTGGGAWRVGDPSTVVVPCGVRGPAPLPSAIPMIAGRIGLDREPVDLADDDSIRWLMACIWPDQHDRFERLRNAIEIAREHPAAVITGDAVEGLRGAAAVVSGSGHPVVITSWVLNYLTPADRQRFVATLDEMGADSDLSWVALESPGLCPGMPFPAEVADSFLTHLLVGHWRAGRRTVRHLAECHPHGYWLRWNAADGQ